MAVIECAARELFFGALFINLLLLFPRRDLNSRLLPLFVLLYGGLVALRLFLPGWFLT